MSVRVGINGFGRIGRNVFRAAALGETDVEIVAVNDITDTATLAHLLDYDSIFGRYPGHVHAHDDHIHVDERRGAGASPSATRPSCPGATSASTWSSRAPASSPTATRPPCTSRTGRKKVIISAPAKGPDITIVHGRQRRRVRPRDAPRHLERLVHHELPRAAGQGADGQLRGRARLHDHLPLVHRRPAHPRRAPHATCAGPARRRSRSSPPRPAPPARSARCIPALKGKLDGIALRVPTPDGSVVDLVAEVEPRDDASRRSTRPSAAAAEAGPLEGILGYTEDPIVSRDIVGDPRSSLLRRQPHDGQRHHRQADLLVRQRVGLLVPGRRPGRARPRLLRRAR